ncbi:MAG: carboxypeptidase regulatory-like domain-containing protein [Planctomycetota bacterium]
MQARFLVALALASLLSPTVAAQAQQEPLRITVSGPDGKPYPGATVQVLRFENADAYYAMHEWIDRDRQRTVARLTTPKNGCIGVQLPVAIPHRICVDVPPFAIEWRAGIYAGGEIEIQLREAAILEGTVTDDTGAPIPAERVLVQASGNPTTQKTWLAAGADGCFRMDRCMPGNYYVEATSSRAACHGGKNVKLRSGEKTMVAFLLERGATLRGQVRDEQTGLPIAGATLGISWTFDKPVASDADGRFELRGLGGPFVNNLFLRHPSYAKQQIQRPAQKQGAVTLDLAMRRGIEVSGRIVDAQGSPVGDCYVAVVGMTRDLAQQQTDWLSARTDEAGRYQLSGVRELLRPVVLVRRDGNATWFATVPKADNKQHSAVPDITLLPRQIVQGVLLDGAGDPMPGSRVALIGMHDGAPRHCRKGNGALASYLGHRAGYTDARGRFFFGDLAPGNYELHSPPLRQQVRVRAGVDPKPIELAH